MSGGQRRKATIRIYVDRRDVQEQFVIAVDMLKKDVDDAVQRGIYNYLRDLLGIVKNVHDWQDRSGKLRESIEIKKIEDGFGLTANPLGYDYGGLLEWGWEVGYRSPRGYHQNYAWIRPAHEMRKTQLPVEIAKEINRSRR